MPWNPRMIPLRTDLVDEHPAAEVGDAGVAGDPGEGPGRHGDHPAPGEGQVAVAVQEVGADGDQIGSIGPLKDTNIQIGLRAIASHMEVTIPGVNEAPLPVTDEAKALRWSIGAEAPEVLGLGVL